MIDESYIEGMVAPKIAEFINYLSSARFDYTTKKKIENDLPILMNRKLIKKISDFIETECELENLAELFALIATEDVMRVIKKVQGELENE